MPRKTILVILVGGLAASASANGAMSLALSVFSWYVWLPYVGVTLVYEAFAMGWWLRCPVRRSLWASLLANALTMLLGGFFSGIVGYGFLGIFASPVNPDPFLQVTVMLTTFGIGSAFFEAAVWRDQLDLRSHRRPYLPLLGKSLVVHLVGVPLALGIEER